MFRVACQAISPRARICSHNISRSTLNVARRNMATAQANATESEDSDSGNKFKITYEWSDERMEDTPRYCYHERLKIAGNCRMCLVESGGKLVAGCVQEFTEGVKVFSNTPKVRKAREGVTEMLLKNHPLDCPVCDQGGECDLQDQSMQWGNRRSRNRDGRRAVESKTKTSELHMIMTRCIQCTRCVRFEEEIGGGGGIGLKGRGEAMEIWEWGEASSTKLQKGMKMKGNTIDVCPVGCLEDWDRIKSPIISSELQNI